MDRRVSHQNRSGSFHDLHAEYGVILVSHAEYIPSASLIPMISILYIYVYIHRRRFTGSYGCCRAQGGKLGNRRAKDGPEVPFGSGRI